MSTSASLTPATGTLIDVAAERCRPATLHRQQDFHVLPREPPTAPLDECVSRGADEIGHLQWRPRHLLVFWRLDFQRQRIQRTGGGVEMTLGEVQIDRGLF